MAEREKFLILGSNSFSGATFADFLAAQGHDVMATSRSEEAHQAFLPYKWQDRPGKVRFKPIDLNHDIEALKDREGTTPRMVREFAKRREQFIRDLNRVPGFRCSPPEGAFYAWVNISDTGMSAEELCRIMLEEAGVAAIPGAAFGAAGADFIRFSFASSTSTLQEAVERILRFSSAWHRAAVVR